MRAYIGVDLLKFKEKINTMRKKSVRENIMKRLGIVLVSVSLMGGLAGCGSKTSEEAADPYAELRNEVVTFVNEDLAAISSERDEAVSVYNAYFTSDNKEPDAFLSTLNNDAIPKMQNFVNELDAIETTSEEVTNLKNLYLQGSQKQLDAMNKVAQAISEENTDYLTEADTDITDSKSYFTQYESQLKLIAIDCNITINGSFSDATDENAEENTDATEESSHQETDDSSEASGSIQEVTE
jgi:hypothetical protein